MSSLSEMSAGDVLSIPESKLGLGWEVCSALPECELVLGKYVCQAHGSV